MVEPPCDDSRHDPEPLRAFFALAFDASARDVLRERCAALRRRLDSDRIRWVPVENIHLTLRFLGNVGSDVLPKLLDCVRARISRIEPFSATTGEAAVFPSRRKPRAIALCVQPEGPLEQLADAVERGVVDVGFDAAPRSFRAHVTLARFRRGAERVADVPFDPSPIPIEVAEVVLFRSELSQKGAAYTELARCRLAGVKSSPCDDESA